MDYRRLHAGNPYGSLRFIIDFDDARALKTPGIRGWLMAKFGNALLAMPADKDPDKQWYVCQEGTTLFIVQGKKPTATDEPQCTDIDVYEVFRSVCGQIVDDPDVHFPALKAVMPVAQQNEEREIRMREEAYSRLERLLVFIGNVPESPTRDWEYTCFNERNCQLQEMMQHLFAHSEKIEERFQAERMQDTAKAEVPTTPASAAQTRVIRREPAAVTLPMFNALLGIRRDHELRFGFNPLEGHPLAGDPRALGRFVSELIHRCTPRGDDESMRMWTLKDETDLGLMTAYNWANPRVHRQFPGKFGEDGDFYALLLRTYEDIVDKPLTDAPQFTPAVELEREEESTAHQLRRQHDLSLSNGGALRTIRSWLEENGILRPPPVPTPPPDLAYSRFQSHNAQIEALARFVCRQYAAEIERYFRTPTPYPAITGSYKS